MPIGNQSKSNKASNSSNLGDKYICQRLTRRFLHNISGQYFYLGVHKSLPNYGASDKRGGIMLGWRATEAALAKHSVVGKSEGHLGAGQILHVHNVTYQSIGEHLCRIIKQSYESASDK